jgi:hypothetical protein
MDFNKSHMYNPGCKVRSLLSTPQELAAAIFGDISSTMYCLGVVLNDLGNFVQFLFREDNF